MKKNFEIEEVVYSKYCVDAEDGRILYADDNFCNILGYTQEDIRERELTLWDIIVPEDLDEYAKRIGAVIAAGGEAYLSHGLVKKSGESIYVFCYGKVRKCEDGSGVVADIMITDVTAGRQLQEYVEMLAGQNTELNHELSDKNSLITSLIDNFAGGVGVFEVGKDKLTAKYLSQSFYKMFGINVSEVDGHNRDVLELTAPDYRKSLMHQIRQTIASNTTTIGEHKFLNFKGGKEFFVQACISVLSIRSGVINVCIVFYELGEKKKRELEKNAYNELIKMIVEGSNEYIVDYSFGDDIMHLKKIDDGELVEVDSTEGFFTGLKDNEYIHPDDYGKIGYMKDYLSKNRDTKTVDFRFRFFTEEYRWYRMMLVSIASDDGTIGKLVGKMYSIHEEKLRAAELKKKAELDSLTNIYNHQTFENKVIAELGRKFYGSMALFVMDIDDFKLINDALGHYEGDRVLADVALKLKQISERYGGYAGRLGGDEFSVFIPGISKKEQIEEIAGNLGKDIADMPCDIKHTASIGIYMKSDDEDIDYYEMYRRADKALYSSKRAGKNRYNFYEDTGIAEENLSDETKAVFTDTEYMLLDNYNAISYISDLNNYDLYYINNACKKNLGMQPDDESYVGRKCYEVLQGRSEPCPFCTNNILDNKKTYIWNHVNDNDGCTYVLKDSVGDWNGHRSRLELAINITDVDSTTRAMAERLDNEDLLNVCVNEMAYSNDFNKSCERVLEAIGAYYAATNILLFEYSGDSGKIYEWKSDIATSLSITSRMFLQPDVRKCLDGYSNEQGVFMVDSEMYGGLDERLRLFFGANRIWTAYFMSIKNRSKETIGRMLIINPKKHVGELQVVNIIGTYLGRDMYEKDNR